MSPLDAARRLDAIRLRQRRMICVICRQPFAEGERGHTPDCPLLAMPRVVAALEERDLMLDSMARVWGKVQGSERAEDKHYAEMGDILYHATDGEQGRCGRYDGPPCQEAGEDDS